MADDDIELLKKRFSELAARADRTGALTRTRFLNAAEQSLLLSLRLPACVHLTGGYDGAERRAAVFGEGEPEELEAAAELVCLRVSPKSARFSEELGHRDYLGAALARGITRELVGDVIVTEACAYFICMEPAASVLEEGLCEVRRTAVKCERCALPAETAPEGEERSIVVASARLDALVAAVWKLPREEAKALCERGLVFVDSRLAAKGGASVPEGANISVRGHGRFKYLGLERETKKGKLRVKVSLPAPARS
jgi:RNA-binding protein YlmH